MIPGHLGAVSGEHSRSHGTRSICCNDAGLEVLDGKVMLMRCSVGIGDEQVNVFRHPEKLKQRRFATRFNPWRFKAAFEHDMW